MKNKVVNGKQFDYTAHVSELYVYHKHDVVNCAYLLKSGAVYLELKEGEKYKISAANLLLGVLEILNHFEEDFYGYRQFALLKEPDSEIIEVSILNLKKLIYTYNIGYNLNVFLARLLKLLTSVLAKRKDSLDKDEREIQRMAKIYFEISESIGEIAQKTKFPDLVKLADTLKNELIYPVGKIYSQSSAGGLTVEIKPQQQDEFNRTYSAGSVIFEQGKMGNEMFILVAGQIDIFVNDQFIGQIEHSGSVVGEIALLLGDVRTATLKAKTDVVVKIIRKENLQNFHQQQNDFFVSMGKSLSRSISHVLEMIYAIDEQKQGPQDAQKVGGFLTKTKSVMLLEKLFHAINEVQKKKNYPDVKSLLEKHQDAVMEFDNDI